MNDNLPELNFKEKKEKKRGALGWLKNRLGFGARGAMGEAGINPAAMNVGRALGTAKFGASSGWLAGLLAGNGGLIATIATVAVAAGLYVAHNPSVPGPGSAAFSSNTTPDNYVPAILRSQAANNGSSLDMFKDANKSSGFDMDGSAAAAAKAAAKAAADKAAAEKAAADEKQTQDQNPPAPDQADMAQNLPKLMGGSMGGSLTSQLGGGSNNFSNMGGFGNKFGQGATGAKAGFSSGIGAGFSGMPKFDSRKGKMLAMKGSARPVLTGAKAGKKGKYGAGSFNQAKGLRDVQKSYTGTSIDAARSTQDKAWEGTTGDGTVGAGGAGVGAGSGGAGIMSSPSLDNTTGGGGWGGTGTPGEPVTPNVPSPTDVSPWAGMLQQAMMYILLSAVLSGIAGYLVKTGNALMSNPYTAPMGAMLRMVGMLLAVVALGLAIMALMIGIKVMGSQMLLGTVYVLGAGVATAAAVMAMTGASVGPITPLWMSAIAGVIGLMGSMFGGK